MKIILYYILYLACRLVSWFRRRFGYDRTLHISMYGDDETGDGTVFNPWETMWKANKMSLPGDTIYVGPGDYIQPLPLPTKVQLGKIEQVSLRRK